jgi:endonuclease/exonuclease/phosphatase family metal-dependent hydrolase
MEEEYGICPSNDTKVLMGDVNAKIGREEVYRRLIRRHSLHVSTNYNGQRLVEFAAAKNVFNSIAT